MSEAEPIKLHYEEYFLKPGFVYMSMSPSIITTVLGSCVSICLYDCAMQYGGMNHYLMPEPGSNRNNSTMFGIRAIEQLYQAFIEYGSRGRDLSARIVGGAYIDGNDCSFEVASGNVMLAKRILGDYNIPIVSEETGGTLGRKVSFNSETGDVSIVRLKKTIAYTEVFLE